MKTNLPRRTFIGASSASILLPAFGVANSVNRRQDGSATDLHDSFPQTSRDQAKAIVSASHFRFDEVKRLVKENRALAKASWDWGFGDWETAIGAASHTGQRKIVEFLIENGARPTVFSFAALDKVDSLRAICVDIPGIQGTLGPHGINLMIHAKKAKSKKVIEYLNDLGGADVSQPGRAISGSEAKPYLGAYQFGSGNADRFEVAMGKSIKNIGIRKQGGTLRYLSMFEPHVFSIYGAENVTIRFDIDSGGIAGSLSVEHGSFKLSARRI
jgi:hypothetical protein